MKHIFIVNPNAGHENRMEEIEKELKENHLNDESFTLYETQYRHDAERYVKELLEKREDPEEIYRFYACGGDGTLYDVINGIGLTDRCEVACLAYGSGNDFIKNFKADISDFRNIENAIAGTVIPVDLMKINDHYGINITNYGFDGEVTAGQIRYRRLPLVTGPMAYNIAAVTSLLFKMNQFLRITIDDQLVMEEKGLLAIAANGYCYGGGFRCAPLARVDDGTLDFCLVKKIGRMQALSFMNVFKKGEHLTNKKLKDKLLYIKGKKAVIESDHPVSYSIDGEVFKEAKIEISILPKRVKFVLPKGVENN